MKQLAINFHKAVSYWNNTEGANVDVYGNRNDDRWGIDVSGLDAALDIEGVGAQEVLLGHLNTHFDYDGGILPRHLDLSHDGHISLCLIEDGNGNPIQNTSEHAKNNPTEQTYICDYDIMVTVQEVSRPNREELGVLFPSI